MPYIILYNSFTKLQTADITNCTAAPLEIPPKLYTRFEMPQRTGPEMSEAKTRELKPPSAELKPPSAFAAHVPVTLPPNRRQRGSAPSHSSYARMLHESAKTSLVRSAFCRSRTLEWRPKSYKVDANSILSPCYRKLWWWPSISKPAHEKTSF